MKIYLHYVENHKCRQEFHRKRRILKKWEKRFEHDYLLELKRVRDCPWYFRLRFCSKPCSNCDAKRERYYS